MKIGFVGAQNAPHELACTHWSGIRAAGERIPHELKIFCCRSGPAYVDAIIKWRPEILVYNLIDMVYERIDDARRLRDSLPDTRIVFWYTDCRTPETSQIDTSIDGLVDLFVTSSDDPHGFHEAHFGMKPQWLPQAAEPLRKPVYNEHAAYDFLFIGGKYNRPGFMDRMELVSSIERRLGLTVLNGHKPHERAKMYQAMPALYSSSKFSLDISHFWDIPRYTSNRYWVIPAFFGMCLTKRFPRHEELVPEAYHVYWDSIDELEEKMNYYRKNENERKDMIVKGWQYAKDNHTYEHRIKRIFELLDMVY